MSNNCLYKVDCGHFHSYVEAASLAEAVRLCQTFFGFTKDPAGVSCVHAHPAIRDEKAMLRAKGGVQFSEQAKLSVLVVACEGLLSIIHDDLTHERQREHAEAIDEARAAIAAAMN